MEGAESPCLSASPPLALSTNAHPNHLIQRLAAGDRNALLALTRPVDLRLEVSMAEPGGRSRHVHFPTTSFVSLIAKVPNLDGVAGEDGAGVEVGMVGSEGLFGVQALLGVEAAPLHALVQGAGEALRVDVAPFVRLLAERPAMRSSFGRYLYVLMRQMATASACLRFHTVEPRLARWLLMTNDRAHSDQFEVTQEFLGYMLGVRRVGVSAAAAALQRAGLIRYSRGQLQVLDRAGLETAACTCYAEDQRVYAELLG